MATSPNRYTVVPPMGGRNTERSGRVTSSGNMPAVCSNRVRRRFVSVVPKRRAMPGRCQTGSMAALTTETAPPVCSTVPSLAKRPAAIACWISEMSSRARVTAMLGRMSVPSPISAWNSCAARWPQGSSETMVWAPAHWPHGPIATAGSVLARSGRRSGFSAPDETASAR